MTEDPFKNKEKLAIRLEIAAKKDWQVCRDLRIESITGKEAVNFGLTEQEVKEEKDKSEEKWQDETNSDAMFSVLTWSGSKPVGLGRTKRVGKIWHLRNGYVREDFRGMGIQPKMIAMRLVEIRKRGGVKVTVGVEVGNQTSIKNLESFGFKTTGTEFAKNGQNFYSMRLDNVNNFEVIKKINEVLNEG